MRNEGHFELSGERQVPIRFRVLRSWFARLKGLLGTGPGAEPVVLVGTWSVHTYGMAYSIDIALADGGGRVLASVRDVPPRRVISARGARFAFERPTCDCDWISADARLDVSRLG